MMHIYNTRISKSRIIPVLGSMELAAESYPGTLVHLLEKIKKISFMLTPKFCSILFTHILEWWLIFGKGEDGSFYLICHPEDKIVKTLIIISVWGFWKRRHFFISLRTESYLLSGEWLWHLPQWHGPSSLLVLMIVFSWSCFIKFCCQLHHTHWGGKCPTAVPP